jgi:TP901 family phage tail tape measure protein
MATIRFGIQFASEGATQTIAELLRIRDASKAIADQAPSVAQLATSLGTTGQSAQKLANDLGRSPTELNAVIASLKSMQAAGVSAEQQVLSLSVKFGLTAEQAQKMRSALSDGTAEYVRLSSSLGITAQNAKQFAEAIGLPAATISKVTDRLGELDKAGLSTGQKFRTLTQEFGITRKQFEELNLSFSNSSKAQTALAQSLGTTIGKAREFTQATGLSATKAAEAVARYKELTAAGASVGEKQRALTQELGLTSAQFERLARTANATKAGFAAIAGSAGAVSAGIGAIANKGSQEFAEFDGLLRQFGVIGEATAPQVAAVRSEIERLGTSTQKAPKEVAALSIELSKAGFKADEVGVALGGIVQSSQATGEGLARTGEVIGNVINQFKLTAKDTTNIADLLTVTSNKTASGTNDLGEALAYVGTEAKGSNQSLKDTLLALGLLADSGIKGSSAGTGLAEALKRLKLASANATTELGDLKSKGSKTAVAAFKTIEAGVRDASGQLRPLPEILKNLKAGMAQVGSQGDKDLINNALFGVQGGRVMNVLLSATNEKVSELDKSLQGAAGASQKAGEALSQGPAAGMKQLSATTDVALVKVGEILQGPFSLMISLGQNFVQTFVQLPAPMQAAIVGVGGFAAVLAAATAALAAYNLAQGQNIVTEVIAASGVIARTAAELASTAVQKGRLAATIALNGATIAGNAVQAAMTGQVTASTIAMLAQSVATKGMALTTTVMTATTAAYSAVVGGALIPSLGAAASASGAFLFSIAPLILTLGLAVGAIAAMSAAFSRSPGAKFGQEVEQNTEKIKKLRAESEKPITPKIDTKELDQYRTGIEKLVKLIQEKGPILGLQEALAGDGAKTEFGDQGAFITSAQRGNQIAMEALAAQSAETGAIVDESKNLMDKYGVALLKTGENARKSAEDVNTFNKSAKEKLRVIQNNIAALQAEAKTASPDRRKEIEQEVSALKASEKALKEQRDRLNESTAATRLGTQGVAAFTEESKKKIKVIEDTIAILQEQKKTATTDTQKNTIQNDITLLEKSKAALQARAQALLGDSEALKTQADVAKEAAEAQKALEDGIKKVNAIASKNAKGSITADDAVAQVEAAKAEYSAKKLSSEQILELQKETSEAILKIRKNEISEVKAALENGTLNEEQAIKKLQEVRSKSGNDSAAGKAAASEILAIKKNAVDAEVATIQAGIAEIDAARAGGKISDVKAEKATTVLKQEEMRKRIKLAQDEVDLATGTDKTKAIANLRKLNADLEKEQAESRKRVKALEKQERDEKLATELAQIAAQVSKIEALKASGRISDVEAEEKLTALKIEELEKQAEAAKKNADAEDDPKKKEKLEADAEKANAEVEKAQADSAARILAIKVKALEEESAKALALVKAAEQERSNAIQKSLNAGTKRQEDASRERLDNQRETIQKEIEAAEEAERKLAELESTISNPKAREEFEKKKLEAASKTAGAIGKLLENEAQQQEQARQTIIRGIEREQAARSQAIDLQIAQLNRAKAARDAATTGAELASGKEIAAINAANAALQRQGQLRAAQGSLEKARLDAALLLAERSGDGAQVAAVKAAQFAAEQRNAQAALAQQIKTEEFAQRRALIEAKINELKAKQAVLTAQQSLAEANLSAAKAKGEADSALQKAQQLGPGAAKDKAIADAQQQQRLAAEQAAAQKLATESGLAVAKQGATLAKEAVTEVQAQNKAQKEIQATQQQTLALEQQTAKARFDGEAAISRQNALLAQQQKSQEGIANAAQKTADARGSGGSLPGRKTGGDVSRGNAYIVGEVEPEVFVPGASGTILNQQQIAQNLNTFMQVRSIAGLPNLSVPMPSIRVQSDPIAPLLNEIKLLRTTVESRTPTTTIPVTFGQPDSAQWDDMLKLQRSLLRGQW